MKYMFLVLDPRYIIKAMRFWLKQCKMNELADRIETKVKFLLSELIEQYNIFCIASRWSFNVAQAIPRSTFTYIDTKLVSPSY